MSLRNVLGRGPTRRSSYDTLLRCVSAWVDVLHPTAGCPYSTNNDKGSTRDGPTRKDTYSTHATTVLLRRSAPETKSPRYSVKRKESANLRRRLPLEAHPRGRRRPIAEEERAPKMGAETRNGFPPEIELDEDPPPPLPPQSSTSPDLNPIISTSTVVAGLGTLRQISLGKRTHEAGRMRERLWYAWIATLPLPGTSPAVHFSILLRFIRLAEVPEDTLYLSTVLGWLFSGQDVLPLPQDSLEGRRWQIELCLATFKAILASWGRRTLRVGHTITMISKLFGQMPRDTDLLFNRLIVEVLSMDYQAGLEVLEYAKSAEANIWSSTAVAIFYAGLSEGDLETAKRILQSRCMNEDVRRASICIWIESTVRDPDIRIPQKKRRIFGEVLMLALQEELQFKSRIWRSALQVLLRSGDNTSPVQVAEALDKRIKDRRLEGPLCAYLPRQLFRNVPLSRSKHLIERLRRLLPSLSEERHQPQAGHVDPKTIFTTELREPTLQRRLRPTTGPLTNLTMMKVLRVAQNDPSFHSSARLPRYMLHKVTQGEGVDPITTNLLLHSVLRWDKSITPDQLKSLFDRIFVHGYPGCESFPNGFFGTLDQPTVTPASASSRIHPERHARPFYKQFIRAFQFAGDRESVRRIVGLLHIAREAELVRQKAEMRERRSTPVYLERRRQHLLRLRPKQEDPVEWESLTVEEMRKRLKPPFYDKPPPYQDGPFYSADAVL